MTALPFVLDKNTVHLWKFDWSAWEFLYLESMHPWLSDEEKQKFERLRIAEDKARFCVGRAMLRYLSGRYLECDGKNLQLETGKHGKPSWQDFDDQLSFNISHSGNWVVIAFTSGIPVGIDVEQTKRGPRFNYLNVAKHAFHPMEVAAIDAMPDDQKKQKFYEIWACKEAVIKAIGVGLHGTLHQCPVLPLPESEKWGVITCEASSMAASNITIRKLIIDTFHVGALALHGSMCYTQLKQWRLADSGWPL